MSCDTFTKEEELKRQMKLWCCGVGWIEQITYRALVPVHSCLLGEMWFSHFDVCDIYSHILCVYQRTAGLIENTVCALLGHALLCSICYSSLHKKTGPSRWCKLVYECDKIEGKGNSPAVWCQKLWVNKIIILHLYHNCHVFPSNGMYFTQNSIILKSVYCAQPAEILLLYRLCL